VGTQETLSDQSLVSLPNEMTYSVEWDVKPLLTHSLPNNYVISAKLDVSTHVHSNNNTTTRSSAKIPGGRSPRAQGSLFLMLGVLRIGQHGGRYDPSTVKCTQRERERERETTLT